MSWDTYGTVGKRDLHGGGGNKQQHLLNYQRKQEEYEENNTTATFLELPLLVFWRLVR